MTLATACGHYVHEEHKNWKKYFKAPNYAYEMWISSDLTLSKQIKQ